MPKPAPAAQTASPERGPERARAEAGGRDDEFLRAIRQLSDGARVRRSIRLVAFLGDSLAIILAVMIGAQVRFGDPFAMHGLNLLGFILPIYWLVAINQRCFQLVAIRRISIGLSRAVMSFAITLGIVGLAAFFLAVTDDFSRVVLALGSTASILFIALSRIIIKHLAQRADTGSIGVSVVIQDGIRIPIPPNALLIDTAEHDLRLELDNPYLMDRLGHYLRFAEKVIVACPPERRRLWSVALKGADIEGELIAPEIDAMGAVGLGVFGASTTLLVSKSPLGAHDRVMKRALDLLLTILALPLLLPVMGLVALAIRLDSPGPVLFRQARLGLGNRLFSMYKFRSMYVEGSDSLGATSTGREDSRITRVGRFIRATSLDEIPQVFNVLSGEMSIVGPRPHPILCKAEDRLFWDIDVAYWHRHAMKPGITGLAQVRGHRGATENTAQFVNRLQADLEYLQDWSLWRDLAIILATFRVLVHRNAY